MIFRPVFFMENLTSPWFLNGNTLAAAMDPKTVLQMIAVDDIGKYGARVHGRIELERPGDRPRGRRNHHAPGRGDSERGLVRPLEFVRVPIEEVRKNSQDYALMLEWFDRVGFDADIVGLEREFGIAPTRLKDWAARQPG